MTFVSWLSWYVGGDWLVVTLWFEKQMAEVHRLEISRKAKSVWIGEDQKSRLTPVWEEPLGWAHWGPWGSMTPPVNWDPPSAWESGHTSSATMAHNHCWDCINILYEHTCEHCCYKHLKDCIYMTAENWTGERYNSLLMIEQLQVWLNHSPHFTLTTTCKLFSEGN